MVGEHLELAGEDGNLGELLLLPLHNIRLVFREPGGDQISEMKNVTGKTTREFLRVSERDDTEHNQRDHLSKRW